MTPNGPSIVGNFPGHNDGPERPGVGGTDPAVGFLTRIVACAQEDDGVPVSEDPPVVTNDPCLPQAAALAVTPPEAFFRTNPTRWIPN